VVRSAALNIVWGYPQQLEDALARSQEGWDVEIARLNLFWLRGTGWSRLVGSIFKDDRGWLSHWGWRVGEARRNWFLHGHAVVTQAPCATLGRAVRSTWARG
jgi:hypothetical protein